MAKFLDASGLNQYTQALKNGTLVVGRAQDSSRADFATDASTAFYASHAAATGLIGIIPLENIPQGALEKLVKVADETAMLALTIEDVQNGDSVLNLETSRMYVVTDEDALGTMAAFTEYSAGTAMHALQADYATAAGDASTADYATDASTANYADEAAHAASADVATEVDWSGIQNKPTEYKPEAHTHQSTDVSALASYSVAGSYTAVADGDSLNVALGKIEKKALDASNTADWGSITNIPSEFPVAFHTQDGSTITALTGYSVAGSYAAVDATDSLETALGKIEKKALDASNTADWGSITNIPSEFTPELHTQDGSTITALTGYSVAQSYTAVAASDTLEVALGKIEKKALDASNTADWGSITNIPSEFTPALHTQDASTITALTGYSIASEYAAVAATDSLEVALGKIEKKAVDASNTADWGSITNKPTEFTPELHTQDASTITALTGYQKAGAPAAIAATDSLEEALGKLEAGVESAADVQPIESATITAIINGTF